MLFSLANVKRRSVRDPDGEMAVVPKLLHGRTALKLLAQAIEVFEGYVGKPRSRSTSPACPGSGAVRLPLGALRGSLPAYLLFFRAAASWKIAVTGATRRSFRRGASSGRRAAARTVGRGEHPPWRVCAARRARGVHVRPGGGVGFAA